MRQPFSSLDVDLVNQWRFVTSCITKTHIPCGIVCNGTEEGNSFYGNFVPDLFVYGDYDKDAVDRVIQRQRKIVNGANKHKPGNNAFIILDDCMYDTKFVRDTQLRTIFLNGRHYKLFF